MYPLIFFCETLKNDSFWERELERLLKTRGIDAVSLSSLSMASPIELSQDSIALLLSYHGALAYCAFTPKQSASSSLLQFSPWAWLCHGNQRLSVYRYGRLEREIEFDLACFRKEVEGLKSPEQSMRHLRTQLQSLGYSGV